MKLSEIIFNGFVIFFVLIAFSSIAHKVMVCDLIVETEYPLCNGSVSNLSFVELDFYSLNYYKDIYSNTSLGSKSVVTNCKFSFKR